MRLYSYTKKRSYAQDWHETLKDVWPNLLKAEAKVSCKKVPTVEQVSKAYQEIIRPNWKFEIADVVSVDTAILGFLTHDKKDEILTEDGKPASAKGIHITLLSIDPSVSNEKEKIDQVTAELKKKFCGKAIKVGNRNGQPDLEFGISGSKPSERIRPSLK